MDNAMQELEPSLSTTSSCVTYFIEGESPFKTSKKNV